MNTNLYNESEKREERSSNIRQKLKAISKIQAQSISQNKILIRDTYGNATIYLSDLGDIGLKSTIETLIETALNKEVITLEAELKALMSDYKESEEK